MSKYKIEKGIPVAGRYRQRSELRVTIDSMEVGDSFAFDKDDLKMVENARISQRRYSPDKRFSVSPKELRIWRIK